MARNFAYQAKDREGQAFAGTVTADNEKTAVAHIRSRGLFVTRLQEEKAILSLTAIIETLQPVSSKELAVFCRQFAVMTDAGIPLLISLNLFIEQTRHPRFKKALQNIYRQVQAGEMLSRAMETETQSFPAVMVSMVRAGELGGVLDVVMKRLAVQFEKEHRLQEKVKSALTYPAVVVSITLLALGFMTVFVFPVFTQLFTNMNVSLPLPTRILLAFGEFGSKNAAWLAAGGTAALWGFRIGCRQQAVKRRLDQGLLYLPVFGSLRRQIATARFTRTLASLLRGGVSILAAIDVVRAATGHAGMAGALTAAENSIREGRGLAAPLAASRLFAPMVIQLIAVGEKAGRLDDILDKIADFYEDAVDDRVSRLSSLLEPVLIGMLGMAVGLIVLAILVPLFDVMTGVSLSRR